MSDLASFIAEHNGKVVGDGQCGSLVRAKWNEVDLTVPPSYTNSKDYWPNPVPGYDKVQTPQPGDIAIYDGHPGFPEGHSAIYVGNGQVFEQNANPDGSPAHLYARPTTYLLGYLHKQGGNMADTITVSTAAWQDGQNWKTWGGKVEAGMAAAGLDPNVPDWAAFFKDLVAHKAQSLRLETELSQMAKPTELGPGIYQFNVPKS